MNSIRKIGTALLCGVMVVGCIIVMSTVFAYVLAIKGYSNKVTTWFTQNASISLDWVIELKGSEAINRYAKEKTFSEKYNSIISGVEGTIEDFCTSAFPENTEIHNIVETYKKDVLHYKLSAELGEKTNSELADEAATDVENFADWCENQGIKFMYVQLPCGTRIEIENGSENVQTTDLELQDMFAENIENRDIEFINIDDNENLLKSFSLDASGHWMPEDALKTTSILAEKLNENYGLNIDLSKFDENNYENAMDLNPEAQSTIYNEFGYDYKFLIPKDSLNYTVDVNETEIKEGNFKDTLLTDVGNWDRRAGDNDPIAYHDMWTINNGSFVKITNNSITNKKETKILILGDSFSWPITSYLSEEVKEIVTLHPRYFPGYVKNYIQEYKPDIILWIYIEYQVGSENELNFGKVE